MVDSILSSLKVRVNSAVVALRQRRNVLTFCRGDKPSSPLRTRRELLSSFRRRLDTKSEHTVCRVTLLGFLVGRSLGSARSVGLEEQFLVPFEGFEALAPAPQGREFASNGLAGLF